MTRIDRILLKERALAEKEMEVDEAAKTVASDPDDDKPKPKNEHSMTNPTNPIAWRPRPYVHVYQPSANWRSHSDHSEGGDVNRNHMPYGSYGYANDGSGASTRPWMGPYGAVRRSSPSLRMRRRPSRSPPNRYRRRSRSRDRYRRRRRSRSGSWIRGGRRRSRTRSPPSRPKSGEEDRSSKSRSRSTSRASSARRSSSAESKTSRCGGKGWCCLIFCTFHGFTNSITRMVEGRVGC